MIPTHRRIAFSGPSGTGKTTLARFVAERYALPINPIGARSVALSMGFQSPYDVDRAGRREEFQQRLMDEKIAWESSHTSFVTDRTPFDNVAYTRMHCPKCATDAFVIRAMAWSEVCYTRIFLCPLRAFQQTGNDPARVLDPAYHARFYDELVGLFLSYTVRVTLLRATSIEGRQDEIIRALAT